VIDNAPPSRRTQPSAYTAIVTNLTPFEVSLVKAPLSQAMVMFHAMDNLDTAQE
jgi:hypothetical protein